MFFVDENAKFTTSVGSVYANDVDSGSFGDIRYSLEGPNSNHFIVVTNEESQEVSLCNNLEISGQTGQGKQCRPRSDCP